MLLTVFLRALLAALLASWKKSGSVLEQTVHLHLKSTEIALVNLAWSFGEKV